MINNMLANDDEELQEELQYEIAIQKRSKEYFDTVFSKRFPCLPLPEDLIFSNCIGFPLDKHCPQYLIKQAENQDIDKMYYRIEYKIKNEKFIDDIDTFYELEQQHYILTVFENNYEYNDFTGWRRGKSSKEGATDYFERLLYDGTNKRIVEDSKIYVYIVNPLFSGADELEIRKWIINYIIRHEKINETASVADILGYDDYYIKSKRYELSNYATIPENTFINLLIDYLNHKVISDKPRNSVDLFSEKDLERIIQTNLHKIEVGMELIDTQYQIENGFIDILAIDQKNKKCIIELKVVDDCKDIVFQSAYYPTQFDEEVRMITICPGYKGKIHAALKNISKVEMKKYYFRGNNICIENADG